MLVKQLTQSVRKVIYAKSKDLLYFVMACVINREIGICRYLEYLECALTTILTVCPW